MAEFFLDHPGRSVVLSAAAVGRHLGVSDATVVRTAASLGYRGLGELRRAVALSHSPTLGERLRVSLGQAAGVDAVVPARLARHERDLHGLLDVAEDGGFARVVDLLASAARVVVAGTGPSAWIAGYAAALMRRIGVPTAVITDSGPGGADDLATIAAGDVVVALAYSEVQRHVDALLTTAEAAGARTVVISDGLAGRLRAEVDEVVPLGRGDPDGIGSHVATVLFVESVALAVAARRPERATETAARISRARRHLTGSA